MADAKALINHYARNGLFHHIQSVCDTVIKKRGNDPVLLFWRAYGAAMEGNHAEAIRDIEPLMHKRDVAYPVTIALIVYHKMARAVDHEEVAKLSSKVAMTEEKTGEVGQLLAGTFYWHRGEHDKARECADRVLRANKASVGGLTLRGWVDLTDTGTGARSVAYRDRCRQYFDAALAPGDDPRRPNPKPLEVLMGKAVYYTNHREIGKAVDVLNEVMVEFPWFLPAIVEKAKVLAATGDHDQALELCQRALAQDSYDIEALRLVVLLSLVREARPKTVVAKLRELAAALDSHEPRNAELCFRISKPFARLSGRNRAVLQVTFALTDRARKIDPEKGAYATECGYQLTLMQDYGAAADAYRAAAALDASDSAALAGMIYCQISEGQYDEAADQLELFRMIQATIGRTAEQAFLDALLVSRKDKDVHAQRRALTETTSLHEEKVRTAASADIYDYYVTLNPEFMLDICNEYLRDAGSEPRDPTEPLSESLERATVLLGQIAREVPGHMHVQLQLATAKYLAGDFDGASRAANRCLDLDPMFSDAHLLMAQINLAQDNFQGAHHALEQALSHNFQVRATPLYHRIEARVLEHMGDVDKAITVLEAAMKLPGVRDGRVEPGKAKVSLHDRACIYIQLAEVHTAQGHIPEATKIVSDAMREFTGTSEEVRVIVANSQIAVKRGSVKAAIAMLGNVPFSSPAFVKAQMVKADIYLKHRHDRRAYAQCYRDLVDKNPSVHTYILLAEAYMRIQMADQAVESFEAALKLAPGDYTLASRIGKALTATHDYVKAIEYYQTALEAAPALGRAALRAELTELYVKLRKFDHATRLLEESLADEKADDIVSMQYTRKNMLLLSKVHHGTDNVDAAVETLKQALQLQRKIIDKVRGRSIEEVAEQRREAARICFELAQMHEKMIPRQPARAKTFYLEAIKTDDTHEPSMLALAKAYLASGELEACQAQCVTLMRVNPKNEEASVMLADLMFRKNEADAAMYHFQQLLERNPNHYMALRKLVSLLKRAGKLDEAARFIKMAERASPRAVHEPGFMFCKGLFHMYKNEPHNAIQWLNKVRHTGQWGLAATEHMVEIYLWPFEAIYADPKDGDPERDVSGITEVAEKLLTDIPPAQRTLKHDVLMCYTMILTRAPGNVDQALVKLQEILSDDRDNVPALLCLACALIVQKQTAKARNQLKRIAKMAYQADQSEEFVRAWLLLADLFIQNGKFDLAQELCKRALSYDRSCARAWEYLGVVMENEQAYADAAEHYEQSWKFENEASPSVGYKLAFNYLKAKRYVEAIDVCHKVLKAVPDYPRIKKDILDKARWALRP